MHCALYVFYEGNKDDYYIQKKIIPENKSKTALKFRKLNKKYSK